MHCSCSVRDLLVLACLSERAAGTSEWQHATRSMQRPASQVAIWKAPTAIQRIPCRAQYNGRLSAPYSAERTCHTLEGHPRIQHATDTCQQNAQRATCKHRSTCKHRYQFRGKSAAPAHSLRQLHARLRAPVRQRLHWLRCMLLDTLLAAAVRGRSRCVYLSNDHHRHTCRSRRRSNHRLRLRISAAISPAWARTHLLR
jgi:hypothetical protein